MEKNKLGNRWCWGLLIAGVISPKELTADQQKDFWAFGLAGGIIIGLLACFVGLNQGKCGPK